MISRQRRHASLSVLRLCNLWCLVAVWRVMGNRSRLFIGRWFGGACNVHYRGLHLLVASILRKRLIGGRKVFFIVRAVVNGIRNARRVHIRHGQPPASEESGLKGGAVVPHTGTCGGAGGNDRSNSDLGIPVQAYTSSLSLEERGLLRR